MKRKFNILEKLQFYSEFGDNFSFSITTKEMKELLKLISVKDNKCKMNGGKCWCSPMDQAACEKG